MTTLTLLQLGADTTLTDANGRTPLSIAARNGNVPLMVVYLMRGVDVNYQNIHGNTSLAEAICSGQTKSVQFLLKFGAKLSPKDLLLLGREKKLEAAKRMGLDLTVRDKNAWTGLHWAVSDCNLGIIPALLKLGLDVDAKTSFGWTPLHIAAACGSLDAVQMLVDHGADVNSRDGDWSSATSNALVNERRNIAKFLKSKGGLP